MHERITLQVNIELGSYRHLNSTLEKLSGTYPTTNKSYLKLTFFICGRLCKPNVSVSFKEKVETLVISYQKQTSIRGFFSWNIWNLGIEILLLFNIVYA